MDKYNYKEGIKNDIRDYIEGNIDYRDFDNIDELEEQLNEDLFMDDSVTGNASGSYTFNYYEAEENIAHSMDLLGEAMEEFGCGGDYLINRGAEACDVTIRCYLLRECIAEVMVEIEEDFDKVKEEQENEEE